MVNLCVSFNILKNNYNSTIPYNYCGRSTNCGYICFVNITKDSSAINHNTRLPARTAFCFLSVVAAGSRFALCLLRLNLIQTGSPEPPVENMASSIVFQILFEHRLCRKRSKLVLLLRFIPQIGFVHFVRILSAPLSRQKAPPTDSLLFVSFIAFFLLLPANFIAALSSLVAAGSRFLLCSFRLNIIQTRLLRAVCKRKSREEIVG